MFRPDMTFFLPLVVRARQVFCVNGQFFLSMVSLVD